MQSGVLVWRGVAWRGVAWHGVAWHGVAWHGEAVGLTGADASTLAQYDGSGTRRDSGEGGTSQCHRAVAGPNYLVFRAVTCVRQRGA